MKRSSAGFFAMSVLLAALPAGANHTPAAWFDNECASGESLRCWQPIPNVDDPVRDNPASTDETKNSAPNPSSADIYNGTSGTLNSVYFGYDDRGTASPDDDVMLFRMRLLDTPGIGGVPGAQNDGPYDSNTAWNFVLDINGDGWADFLASTDGNSGKNNNPYDNMQLGRNTSTTQQNLSNGASCGAGGQVLWTHESIDPANTTCASSTAIPCDFKYTRIINDTANGGGYFLDMQFPLNIFDSCSGADTDGDGYGGSQLLTPDSVFTFCATTSTQPNDPTAKDLGANGSYRMRKDKPLPCGDACSLDGGCSSAPALTDMTASCGTGTNASPITLTATVLDTLLPTVSGTLVDSIANVTFYYRQDGTPTLDSWIPVTPDAGGANPVTSPNSGTLNLWSVAWDTSALSTSPTPYYWLRVDITDDQGNVTSEVPFRIDLTSCSITQTPVTLASFEATLDGGRARFEWTTETEAANAGFHLYARSEGEWRRLNDRLIPSRVVDSVEPQEYAFEVSAASLDGRELLLEDVATNGATRLHGPFGLGLLHGRRPAPEPVDWAAIRAEHEAIAAHSARSASSVPRRAAAAARAGAAALPPLRLTVSRDGLHRVTYEQLAAAGFDLAGADPAEIALFEAGASVPLRVGGGERDFGPGSWIEFDGRALDTLYTGTNVYTLAADRKAARRADLDRRRPRKGAAAEPFYLETRSFERDRAYSFASPNGDPWYDTALTAFGGPFERSFEFEIDGYLEGAAPAALTVSMWGVTNWPQAPDHHVVVLLNGLPVADERFDGLVDHRVTVSLPAGALREGANTLTLRLPGDTGAAYDFVNLESWAVTWPRAFTARDGRLTFESAGALFRVEGLPSPDVVAYRADGSGLARLAAVEVAQDGAGWAATFPGTGRPATYRVAAVSALEVPGVEPGRDPAALAALTRGPARYLVISHPSFLGGLGPLVREREAQGFSVKVVDVEDVYARFSHGVFDPAAIRGYLAAAAREMGTEYVLLVGGDAVDYRNVRGLGALSFVPTLYARTGPIVSFAPADPLLADIDGDGLQDLAIGRLPVRTAAELDSVVAKTLAYARKDYPRTAVFAADGYDADGAVSFAEISDRFVDRLPAGWSSRRAYLDGLGVGAARAELLGAIDEGVALTSFVGHSGPTVWTFAGLFSAGDAANLTNAGRPTVVSQWGCWNTYFVSPSYHTLGHKLLLSGDRGAAAVLGATTLTRVESDLALGVLLSPRLVEPGKTVGAAVLEAKRELARTSPELIDVLIGWTVLGDPALAVTAVGE